MSDGPLEVFRVKRVSGHPMTVRFTVRCNACGKKHTHGAPEDDRPSHRVSHCKGYPGGYYIQLRAAHQPLSPPPSPPAS